MAAFLAGVNASGGHAFGGAEDDRHGVGPIRRGGQRFNNNRAPGPYDRPRKDGGGRYGGQGGRLTPPRNGGPRRQSSFADGQGGSSREAVQGRSLKSYEDLDAAGGSGTGALDY